jgi:hypothetical protein
LCILIVEGNVDLKHSHFLLDLRPRCLTFALVFSDLLQVNDLKQFSYQTLTSLMTGTDAVSIIWTFSRQSLRRVGPSELDSSR